jgi:hypothetical protein
MSNPCIQMQKLIRDLYIRDNCHPAKSSLVLWFQIPMWVCLSFALRNMSGAAPSPVSGQGRVISLVLSSIGPLMFLVCSTIVGSFFLQKACASLCASCVSGTCTSMCKVLVHRALLCEPHCCTWYHCWFFRFPSVVSWPEDRGSTVVSWPDSPWLYMVTSPVVGHHKPC